MKRRGNSLLRRAEAILVALVVILTSISVPQTVDATVTNTVVSNENLKYITGLANTSFNVNGYYNNNWIKITYWDAGYRTQMKVDGASAVNLTSLTSGESMIVGGLQVTQNLSFVNAGRFVKVSYTVTNPSTESKTFSLGSCADVQIANNDGATIQTTSTGLRMADTGTNATQAQYNLVARNSYGVTNVDSLWFGPYSGLSGYSSYLFTDVDSTANTEATTGPYAGYYTTDSATGKKTALSNVDSAICFAWKDRPIAAGRTQTYSVLLGVGGDANPPQVDVGNDINLDLSNVHRGEPVDVTANITDDIGRTDYLFYALDDGDATLLNTVAGTGAQKTVTSQFTVPNTWEDNSLHTISLWVMNDQGALSDTKKVMVIINGSNSSIVQEATQYTLSYDASGASGTSPGASQVYEKSKVILPVSSYTPIAWKHFGGWSDGTNVYAAGDDYIMPSANTTLTAVWVPDPITLTKTSYAFSYGQAISGQSLSTTGGSGNNTYAVTQGTLPAGITLNSDGSFTGTPTARGTATVEITATDTVSGAVKASNVTIEVQKAVLTVTGAAHTTKQYDGTTAISAATLGTISFSGKFGDEDVSIGTTGGTYNSKNVSEANQITLAGLSLSGSNADNYTLNSATAVITGSMTKKPITLKVIDSNKKVGTPLPTFGIEEILVDGGVSALAPGDSVADVGSFQYATSAGAQSPAATYTVTATSVSGNYDVTLQNGTLTVTQDTPEKDVNYTVSGTLGTNSWYTSAVTIAPVTSTGFNQIWNGTNWVDSIILMNQEQNGIQLKNSTTGEITSTLSGTIYKSDTIAPTITYLSGNPSSWEAQQQRIYFKVTDSQSTVSDGTLTVQKGDSSIPCTFVDVVEGGKEYYFQTVGNGTYIIQTADMAGNVKQEDVNVSYIDTAVPDDIAITGVATGWVNSDVTLQVTANNTSSGNRGFAYSVDGGTTWSAEQPWSDNNAFTISESGDYTNKIKVRVFTEAGLYADSEPISVKLDKEAPSNVKMTAGENVFTSLLNIITFGLFFKDSVQVEITGEDALSGIASIEYQKVDKVSSYDPSGTWQSGDSVMVASDEKFIIYTKVTDAAGNATIINSNGMVVDASKPILTLSYPDNWQTSDVSVMVTASDSMSDLSKVTYTTDEASPQTGTVLLDQGTGVITLSHEGMYHLIVTAEDKSGNTNVQTVVVKLDKTTPGAVVINHSDKYGTDKWYSTSQTVTAQFTPTTGSTEKMQYSLDGGNTWVDGSSVQVTADGVQVVMFRILDELGNRSEAQSVTVQIDKTKPASPKVNNVDVNSTAVTGTAEPGTIISVTDTAGNVLGTVTAGVDGTYSVKIPVQKSNTVLNVNVTDNAGNTSSTTLTVLSASNAVSEMIDALPESLTATNSQIMSAQEDILKTKKAYDALSDSERDQITEARKKKLSDLIARLKSNLVIEADDLGTGVMADQIGAAVLIPELKDSSVGKVKIVLSVTPVAVSTDNTAGSNIQKAAFTLQIKGKSLLAVYDISLLKSIYGVSGELNSSSKVSNSDIVDYITIRLPIPAGYEDSTDLTVVYINDAGYITPIQASIVTIDGVSYMEFKTNHFSEYAIVTKAASSTANAVPTTSATATTASAAQTRTGDTSPIGALVLIMLLSGVVIVRTKRNNKRV